jgi:hypothetical protein
MNGSGQMGTKKVANESLLWKGTRRLSMLSTPWARGPHARRHPQSVIRYAATANQLQGTG